jgi:hypothetical protein
MDDIAVAKTLLFAGANFLRTLLWRSSENSPSETVRKGVLRGWLGNLPSMRRAYQTDLSDAEWSYIEPHLEPHLPTPKAPGRPRVHPLREIL